MLKLEFIGLAVGLLLGWLCPWTFPASSSLYVAAGLLGALDSAFGGCNARIKGHFKLGIFLSWLGQKLGIPLYLAAVVVFGTRMFQNFAEIRRELLTNRQKSDKINQDIDSEPFDGTK